jgi:hypothetical protein
MSSALQKQQNPGCNRGNAEKQDGGMNASLVPNHGPRVNAGEGIKRPDVGLLNQAASAFIQAGLSVLAVKRQDKAPVGPWKQYQTRRATPQEFAAGLEAGADAIALVCGAVSGNLEMLDFDLKGEAFGPWSDIVKQEAPGLTERLVVEQSQSGGFHVLYRCSRYDIPGNMKLAMRGIEAPDENEIEVAGKRYKPRRYGDKFFVTVALIETRGEGGYFLCAPSPGYALQQGRISQLPEITPEERETLVEAARSLNEWVAPVDIRGAEQSQSAGDAAKPGEDFNRRGDVRGLLQRHGWTPCGTRGDNEHWRRPGKDRGISASLMNGHVFYVFTSNGAPFEPDQAYSPFAILAALEHDGDFSATARQLAKEGFGSPASGPGFSHTGSVDVQAVEACTPIPFDSLTPPPIPPESVPGILREFCPALAEAVQVPFELTLCNVLGALAVAVQRKLILKIRDGYFESLNIYALCPLPPGERKSATVEACKRPLVEWQAAKRQEVQESIRDAESERKSLEKAIEAKRAKIAQASTEEARWGLIEEVKRMERSLPEVPAVPRLLADDFTPEAAAVLMAQHEQRIGVLEAEGGIFDTLAGRYSNGVPNLDAVLKFWSGESCQIDRKGRESLWLDNPHLTMVISPQPDVVKGLAGLPGFRGRGLLGRFLYFIPESRLGNRKAEPASIPFQVAEAWRNTLHRLLAMPWAVNEHGKPTGHILSLEPAAYGLWLEFWEHVEREHLPGGEFEHIKDWSGKFPGQAARLAGLFHAATVHEPHRNALTLETMQSALDVAAILSEHAKAAFGLMGSDPAQDCAKAILGKIQQDRVLRFTARDALEKVKGRFPRMERIWPGLTLLEERGFIFPLEAGRSGPGRKPSQTFTVNPLAFGA